MGARQTMLDPSQNSPEVREFEKALRRQVVGQDRAVRRLARVYQVFRAGLSTPGRPVVNLLFLGPHRLRQNAPGGSHGGGPV